MPDEPVYHRPAAAAVARQALQASRNVVAVLEGRYQEAEIVNREVLAGQGG